MRFIFVFPGFFPSYLPRFFFLGFIMFVFHWRLKRWTFVVSGYLPWKSPFTGVDSQGLSSLYLLRLAIALWPFKVLLLRLLPYQRSPKRRRKIYLGWSLASAIQAKSTLPLVTMSVSHPIHTLSIFSFWIVTKHKHKISFA